MKYGKKILTVLIVLALAAGAVGGIIIAVQKSRKRTVTVYRASELNYNWYSFDAESTMEGYVTADAAQNVYASGTAVIKEIVVREGQEVVVGDVLVLYDMEQTRLALEKAELYEQQIQLQMDVANRNLAMLRKLKPVASDGDESAEIGEEPVFFIDEDIDEYEIVEIDDESSSEEGAKILPYAKLNSDSVAYNRESRVILTRDDLAPEDIEGMTDEEIDLYLEQLNAEAGPELGTENNPYRFLCTNGAVIDPSFINHMKMLAEEKQQSFYIQLEVREGDTTDGKLIEAWEMDAARFIHVSKDWSGRVVVDRYITTPSPTPAAKPSATPTGKPSASVTASPSVTATVTPTGTVTPPADGDDSQGTEEDSSGTDSPPADSSGTESPEPSGVTALPTGDGQPDLSGTPDTTQIPDVTGTENVTPADNSNASSDHSEPQMPDASRIPAPDENLQGMPVTHPSAAGSEERGADGEHANSRTDGLTYMTAQITSKYLLTAMDTGDSLTNSGEKGSEVSSRIATTLGLIPSDSQMTAEEIKEAIKQEEQTIKSLKLDLREAVLKTKQAKMALDDGTAKAKMNGIVKTVTNPATAEASGSPVVQVTAAEGLFVKSAIPENKYGSVKAGDFVSIISWTSGQTFSGRVREVSPYPDTSGMFGYGSGATYYPMTIYVSERSQALNDGEWVQVTINGSGEQTFDPAADELYLYRAFVREDSGGKYVLMRGEDGTLTKQYVVTGELSGEGCEILSGLTGDDWVAFPYGKNLSEGSATREGTVDELYMS